jgi:hypothetical protein
MCNIRYETSTLIVGVRVGKRAPLFFQYANDVASQRQRAVYKEDSLEAKLS